MYIRQQDNKYLFINALCFSSIGNTPPWTLPAKAKYSEYDRRRATRYFGVPDFTAPDFFPILSLLVRDLPSQTLSCLAVLKSETPPAENLVALPPYNWQRSICLDTYPLYHHHLYYIQPTHAWIHTNLNSPNAP